MSGLGTIANAAAIICGALSGIVLRRGLPEKWQQTIMQGVALCIVVIGLQMAFKTANIVIVVVSLVIGSIIGEYFDIEVNESMTSKEAVAALNAIYRNLAAG